MNGVCFSSITELWNTPKHLKDKIYEDFNIQFDPCPENPSFDGLSCEWAERNYCNPPFNATEEWVRKILKEQKKGRTTVLLIPARTNTKYFHELILPNISKLIFLRGRVRFVSQLGNKPGASPCQLSLIHI